MNRSNSCGDCRFFYLSDPHRMMGVCFRFKAEKPTGTFEGNITIECPNCGVYFEPKEGEWIDKGSLSCRCNQCGCKSSKEYNCCPNCGADMRGDKK